MSMFLKRLPDEQPPDGPLPRAGEMALKMAVWSHASRQVIAAPEHERGYYRYVISQLALRLEHILDPLVLAAHMDSERLVEEARTIVAAISARGAPVLSWRMALYAAYWERWLEILGAALADAEHPEGGDA